MASEDEQKAIEPPSRQERQVQYRVIFRKKVERLEKNMRSEALCYLYLAARFLKG